MTVHVPAVFRFAFMCGLCSRWRADRPSVASHRRIAVVRASMLLKGVNRGSERSALEASGSIPFAAMRSMLVSFDVRLRRGGASTSSLSSSDRCPRRGAPHESRHCAQLAKCLQVNFLAALLG